jgi:hypothetical protein
MRPHIIGLQAASEMVNRVIELETPGFELIWVLVQHLPPCTSHAHWFGRMAGYDTAAHASPATLAKSADSSLQI